MALAIQEAIREQRNADRYQRDRALEDKEADDECWYLARNLRSSMEIDTQMPTFGRRSPA